MIFSATLNFITILFVFTKISHTVSLQSTLNRNLLKIYFKCVFFFTKVLLDIGYQQSHCHIFQLSNSHTYIITGTKDV